MTVCRQASEPLSLAHTIRHVGDLYQEAEQLDAAEACYQEALAIYRTQANVPALDLANALRPYALLKENLGDAAAAKLMWTEARDLYSVVNVEAGVAECTPNGRIMKAIFKNAWPYQQDAMNLPVANVEAALPFYETVMGFQVMSHHEAPHKSAILARDDIQIGLAENGGDSSQDGAFFEVDNVEAAFAELRANGLAKETADFRLDQHGDTTWRVFFVIAPDGLCYCLGERQTERKAA